MIDSFRSRYLEQDQRRLHTTSRGWIHTVSHSNRLFSRSRRYRSNRGAISKHVPTRLIASSRRFGMSGSSILPSAIAFLRSTSRAFTSCLRVNCNMPPL
ncbi:hypothetical protein PILCRDRAFT_562858 [Piloderma croceum F 1598]|uniref:Uncharacterized protein n=1 Tax=Piloderma croceum (strain F 1598) TaxID=765440 RepID=A0A0C3F3G6_PILCF|nr:hypothetical protein PILCRDRAFT_562858 [Piloderma croceum F 1598]